MNLFRRIELLSVLTAVIACLYSGNVYAMASTGPGGSNAQAVQNLGDKGDGIRIGLIGGQNVYLPHQVLDGNNIQNFTVSGSTAPGWHDTMLTGIMISHGGGSYPDNKGVAPNANVLSMKITYNTDTAAALKTLIETNKCRVIVAGVQWPFTADGNSFETMLYDYYAYKYDVVFANAGGNIDNTQNPPITHTSVYGDAYNGITTGGLVLTDPLDPSSYRKVGSDSLPGPTADGRRKPEIVAPSAAQIVPTSGAINAWANTDSVGGTTGATSWSAPHTAGTAALLLKLADSVGQSDANNHLVIKAAIVNSAFPNIKARSGNSTTRAVFDYDRGYGRIDAFRAYQTIAAGRIVKNTISNAAKGWAFDTVSHKTTHTYQITVQKNSRLISTLTWDRAITWTDKKRPFFKDGIIQSDELTADFANLDLKVYRPDDTINPVFGGLATDDNLEKCDFVAPVSGTFVVKVVNNDASQDTDYGLAFEIVPPISGDFDLNYIVDNYDLSTFVSQWLADGNGLVQDLAPPIGHIDFNDFAIFSQNWLTTNNAYYTGY